MENSKLHILRSLQHKKPSYHHIQKCQKATLSDGTRGEKKIKDSDNPIRTTRCFQLTFTSGGPARNIVPFPLTITLSSAIAGI